MTAIALVRRNHPRLSQTNDTSLTRSPLKSSTPKGMHRSSSEIDHGWHDVTSLDIEPLASSSRQQSPALPQLSHVGDSDGDGPHTSDASHVSPPAGCCRRAAADGADVRDTSTPEHNWTDTRHLGAHTLILVVPEPASDHDRDVSRVCATAPHCSDTRVPSLSVTTSWAERFLGAVPCVCTTDEL